MKLPIHYIVILLLFSACSKNPKKEGDFRLLPQPKEYLQEGMSDIWPSDLIYYRLSAGVEVPIFGPLAHLKPSKTLGPNTLSMAVDTALKIAPEGYELVISESGISIIGKDDAGLFYGLKTLEQFYVDASEQKTTLPRCKISDAPALAYRAIHLDVKHHLEKTEYYYDLIDMLARYKVNAVIVEMEDKLAYSSQTTIASKDALSISGWTDLSDYAAERHISISPLIQGLGHASFILKHGEYKHLRDDPNSDWAFNPLDPETYEVQFDLYRDAIAATPHGKYLHVGGDEVHTTGRNSGKSALELQLYWLGKVSAFAERHNRIPIFWDDMPLKQAEVYDPMFQPSMTKERVDSIWAANEHRLTAFLDRFPKNCIYMRWNYSTPGAYGNTKAMEWFRSKGLKVMGATAGQTRWVLMPQEESNMDAIATFAGNSIANGLNGLLLTLWDDDSPHFELYKRGILAFAEYTWTGIKRDKSTIKKAYRQRAFGHALADSIYAFTDQLELPVAFWKNALLKGDARNYLAAMEDPLDNGVISLPEADRPGLWTKKHKERLEQARIMLAHTEQVARRIKSSQEHAQRNAFTLKVYEQVNEIAALAPQLLLGLEDLDMAKDPLERQKAMEHLEGLKASYGQVRNQLEAVYAQTRILEKPVDYILDQDHHRHLANQATGFDWQFLAEILFFEKLERDFESQRILK